ncbi:alpha/beta hydrolase [Pedobacter caeni]|uniref:Acetyl esterase/lipase n=1 Tax=Pedobacter caeni TaxID=288992 RepID=A0A1M5GHW4_9SPHI|nr:alpha/beta hydrolase [Pedobacter caeni]SHG03307.1 Acetyl esterase/lipase [Pedobacter caeni]
MNTIKRLNLWNGNPPSISGLSGHEISDQEAILELTNVTETELIIYTPDPAINTGTAIIICPGGAYAGLAITSQGYDFAEWLNTIGITGIVLKYRMPNGNKEIPLDDVQESIRYIRKHAAESGIKENRIGIAGFSAGGHLAALSATLFKEEGISNRPDFSMLFYPVISMGQHTQKDTFQNLLGAAASSSVIESYSCEKQVRANTPPALILVSDDDKVVSPVNSTLYYEALKQHGISATLQVFPQGDHAWGIKGFNMFGKKFEHIEEAKVLILNWIRDYC